MEPATPGESNDSLQGPASGHETTILFCRHGETDWNAAGRFQGRTDICLNNTGLGQAQSIADAVSERTISAVWTSQLARARETGAVIVAMADCEHRVDERLQERCLGVFEGTTSVEAQEAHPEAWAKWRANETVPRSAGMELEADLAARVEAALFDIAGAHEGETVVVVGHGGTMKVLLKMGLLNASITTLAVDGRSRRWRALSVNDVSHMSRAPCKRASASAQAIGEAAQATAEAGRETTIFFCRHGETDWNQAGRFQGRTDIPLNDSGRGQARSVAEALSDRHIAVVWTSQLARAHETGALIARAAGCEHREDERLQERGLGIFEGTTSSEAAEKDPDAWAKWRANEEVPAAAGLETCADVAARVEAALFDVAVAHEGEQVAVVGHGATMRVLLKQGLLNASITTLAVDGRGRQWRALIVNDTSHIDGEICRRASEDKCGA